MIDMIKICNYDRERKILVRHALFNLNPLNHLEKKHKTTKKM